MEGRILVVLRQERSLLKRMITVMMPAMMKTVRMTKTTVVLEMNDCLGMLALYFG